MEVSVSQEKKQELVKALSWILLIVSALFLFLNIFFSKGYSTMLSMFGISKLYNPPLEFNFNLYLFITQFLIEMLLCVVIFISAIYVLKYNNMWRKVLVYALIVSIVFLFVSPIISYYNCPLLKIEYFSERDQMIVNASKTSRLVWSYIGSLLVAGFFSYVIMKLSKEEIKKIFN